MAELDYDSLAFILVKAPSRVVSTHKVRNRAEHKELLEKAKDRQLYLYYADIERVEGKVYAKQPWLVDWDSVPDKPYDDVPVKTHKPNTDSRPKPAPTEPVEETEVPTPESAPAPEEPPAPEDTGLSCPICGKPCSSTPGRTLHVKSKHPEQFEEYKKSLK